MSNTPPQIVKMEVKRIEPFYGPERKNTAAAASEWDVSVVRSSGWSQRNLSSAWRRVASRSLFLRRNKGVNLRRGEETAAVKVFMFTGSPEAPSSCL